MAPTTKLSELSLEELNAANQENMLARGEAESVFKARGSAIQDAINRRLASSKLEEHLSGLSDEARAAVLAPYIGKGN